MQQEAETLAVHSLLTIKNTETIKKNLTNVQKWRVFDQRVTYLRVAVAFQCWSLLSKRSAIFKMQREKKKAWKKDWV